MDRNSEAERDHNQHLDQFVLLAVKKVHSFGTWVLGGARSSGFPWAACFYAGKRDPEPPCPRSRWSCYEIDGAKGPTIRNINNTGHETSFFDKNMGCKHIENV